MPKWLVFRHDERGYQSWIAKNTTGFVVNCNEQPIAKYVVLHSARCASITRYSDHHPHFTFQYIKIVAPTVETLSEWVKLLRPDGTFSKICKICKPLNDGESLHYLRGESETARLQNDNQRVGEFEPKSETEGRKLTLRRILERIGQPAFRKNLLGAYGRRCAFSDCDCEDALEAAHILPFVQGGTNKITNGLLIRADLHTLFDLGLISIDPDAMTLHVSKRLDKTVYAKMRGVMVWLTKDVKHRPDDAALRAHRSKAFD